MFLLTENQKDRVKEALYNKWRTCYNCMPFEGGEPVWIVAHTDLDEALQEAFIASDVNEEIDFDPANHMDKLIDGLELSCPSCGTDWNSASTEIGESLEPKRKKITIQVPTINDDLSDFDNLFTLWDQANDDCLDVTFDFSHCWFLRHNAVAFLGGLARLIKRRSGVATFDWDSMREDIRANLGKNEFLTTFGQGGSFWTGNTIPYREDLGFDKKNIIDYLKIYWLGRGWVSVSNRLRDAIVGTVLEIYINAFEHSESPVGIFSCGQHYPNLHVLKLSVIDFGVGIPSNVRFFFKGDPRVETLNAAACIKWAFQRGTTTKPNGTSRGMGLDLLKEFVKLNKERLEIFSHEGYALIDETQETFVNRKTFFEGTLVNITFRCDESYYHFANEAPQGPIF